MSTTKFIMNQLSEKHEEKICPRCNGKFICKVGDVSNCQCSVVKLTDAEQKYIDNKFTDCLCSRCLIDLRQEKFASELNSKLKSILRYD